ncbi:hypothetical protein [Desulfallas thermosapovorans]|uniref:Uncharacterized protein n=1 Tax=Desulfallas thermosapovorans DSM 6562 TaxID=1121431 RepID=A0A5S4ZPY3_9FIRM|nr:hypothetical protein [Desulfallas thermosapovorans]TYO94788.1 hypothetical protein LX24_02039 [Desulfallas thermosapovorans DSM 6562]
MVATTSAETKTDIRPDELIMAILSQLEDDTLEKNLAKIHRALYYLKQNPKFADYLWEFDFDVMGLSPFSDLLDQVLSRLETSHLLDTSNPSYGTYTIKQGYMREEYNKLHDKSRQIVQEMSKELLEYF